MYFNCPSFTSNYNYVIMYQHDKNSDYYFYYAVADDIVLAEKLAKEAEADNYLNPIILHNVRLKKIDI